MNHSPHGAAGLAHTLRRLLGPKHFTTGPHQIGVVHAIHTTPHHSVDLYLTGVTRRSGFTATKTLTKRVPYSTSYTPAVGDVVIVLRAPGQARTRRFVLGKQAA